MDKIIYFENENQTECVCSGEIYKDFIDYAFHTTDFFMLVYVNYYGKGYSAVMKSFMNKLERFKIKTKSTPHWPGTPGTYAPNTRYKVVFYKTDLEAKSILKEVCAMNDWSCPYYPQDLAFFKGNSCWFYSVGHENISAIVRATKSDLAFVESKKLAHSINAKAWDEYYKIYDEQLM